MTNSGATTRVFSIFHPLTFGKNDPDSSFPVEVVGGPVLCHFLGLLVQRAMLEGLEAPARGSPCSEHNDIWLSAHLAHLRLRRAMISDPLGAKDLATHRKRGSSLSRRRRRKPENLCLKDLWEKYGDELWMPGFAEDGCIFRKKSTIWGNLYCNEHMI